MTATQSETATPFLRVIRDHGGLVARVFGKCPVKGCKHRRVADLPAWQVAATRWRAAYLTPYVVGADGRDEQVAYDGRREQAAALRHNGLVCPEHNCCLRLEGLRATYNPEKECSPRCMNATSPACDCSCRGENHGGSRV